LGREEGSGLAAEPGQSRRHWRRGGLLGSTFFGLDMVKENFQLKIKERSHKLYSDLGKDKGGGLETNRPGLAIGTSPERRAER